MDRPDLPRLYAKQRPSIFSREAVGWAFGISILTTIAVGLLAPPVLGMFGIAHLAAGTAYLVGFASAAVGYAAGFLYGGQRGIARQQREMVGGQTVKEPTYLNSGIWNGLSVLSGVNLAATAGLLLAGTTAAHLASVAAVAAAAPVTLGVLALPLAAMAIGSIVRKSHMQRDFNHSAALAAQVSPAMAQSQDISQAMGRSPYINSVSPQEAAQLDVKQGSSLADKVSASKALASETLR